MKLHKSCKVENCVSNDRTRFTLNQVYLDGSQLVATDGRRLVVVPVIREEGDVDGWVSREALVAARKVGAKNALATIHANGSLALENGQVFPRSDKDKMGTYPNWKQVVPKPEERAKFKVSFNAQYLAEIAEAMGTDSVTLEFHDENSSIRVTPANVSYPDMPSQPVGVLMPVRVS